MNNKKFLKFSGRLGLLFVAASVLCSASPALAKPRLPQPPWPQSTIKIFGFDSPYQKVPWRDVALNEEESTLVESWSGYALERSGLFVSPIVIPLRVSETELNLVPARGSIRFWLAPNWSTADEKSDGKGPGHLAHLLELVQLDGKAADVRWALFLNEAGDTLHFVGQTKIGLIELLKAPVEFTAGNWRMITLCYSETNSVILLDNQVIAAGEGVIAPASWEEKNLGLVVGSDVLASPESLADAQFEELTTMRQWPGKSDWQELYFKGTKWRSLLGALGTHTEEQVKVALLKAAGLLPEDYGQAKSSGEGDGPIVAHSYAAGDLWLEITGFSNQLAYLTIHGTEPDTAYEILSKDSLTNAAWAAELPIVLGAAGQDWTPTTVAVGTRTNQLFLWARSWADTDGDGLPDWWEMEHGLDPNNPDTGNTGVSDGYKDSDNDGWNNLQEYQNGTNPSSFNTPPPPRNVTARIAANGSDVLIQWVTGGGAIQEHVLYRYNWDTDDYEEIARIPVPTNSFADFEIAATNLSENIVYAIVGVGSNTTTPAVYFTAPSEETPRFYLMYGPERRPFAVTDYLPPGLTNLSFYGWRFSGEYVHLFDFSSTNFQNGIAALPTNTFTELHAFDWSFAVGFYESGRRGYASWLYPPYDSEAFVDATEFVKSNLRFLLRAATIDAPFGYVNGVGEWGRYPSPSAYEYAHDRTSGAPPESDNYVWKNFLLDPANGAAIFDTGVYRDRYIPGTLPPPPTVSALANPQYVWSYPRTHPPGVPPVLATNDATWVFFDDSNLDSDHAASVGLTLGGAGLVSLASNARNAYGLPINSVALVNSTNLVTIIPAGGAAYPGNVVASFFQTDPPILQTVDYLFGPIGYSYYHPPLPGQSDFNVTNSPPVLITAVGNLYELAAYAKQRMLNGFGNRVAYSGQYFDKAYKVDANGQVTSQETGLLNEQGNFLPTEPGLVAITTQPDVAQGGMQGTGLVHVVKIQFDVNHDGEMDLTYAGPDNTSETRPFTFWVNNDYDLYERDMNIPRGANCDNNVIDGFRDLEDFARLWISGLPALPSAQGYTVSLSWRNATGNPSIKLYRAYETNGGTAYLQDTNVALQQVLYSAWPGVGGYGGSLGAVSLPGPFGAGPFTFPSNYFAVQGTNTHFLFEGAGIGSGELALTISQGTNVLAETSAWFDLRDIKDMYEQVDIRDVSDATPNTLTSTYHETKVLSDDASEDKSVIVFVHGWRMGVWDYHSFSESMFKRLYWQGYRGRFAALRWPTLSHDDFNNLVDVLNDFQSLFTYNKSEFRAFQSGRGVSDYFTHLRQRFPDRTIGVCAHSMGGIVTMQALRLQLAAGQTNIDNLVIMQAAVPAHCYDASLANYAPFLAAETNILSMRTPDTYRSYPGAINSAVRNQIVNFFNTNDFALATGTVQGFGSVSWEGNEISYKPDQGFGYSSDGTNAYKSFALFTDARQIMSFVARPRSKAVGALPGVNGVIHGGQVDLKGNFGFNTDKSEHSAQFNWNIHRLNGFYSQLLTDLLQ